LKYKAARKANLDDLEPMFQLPKRPGQNSVGKRSLAFCHPNHGRETLEAYFAAFRQGIFVSEAESQIVSFACTIRTSCFPIQEPMAWSDATGEGTVLSHSNKGEWLYVSRLAYTAGPGHAHLSEEIGPLLTSLQELTVELNLQGVAFPTRFSGFRERSGTTEFQRSTIDNNNSLERSGLRPLGIALYVGFKHEIALPNYLGDGRHFAMMVWRNDQRSKNEKSEKRTLVHHTAS